MNRRGFLKTCVGGVAAAMAVPALAVPPEPLRFRGLSARLDEQEVNPQKRPGMEMVFDAAQHGDPTPIVSMTVYHGSFYVATGRSVYRVREIAGEPEVSLIQMLFEDAPRRES